MSSIFTPKCSTRFPGTVEKSTCKTIITHTVSSYVYTNHYSSATNKTKTTKRPPEVFEISSKRTRRQRRRNRRRRNIISIANKRFRRRYSYYAKFHIFTENDDSDDDSDDDKDEDAECERDLSRSLASLKAKSSLMSQRSHASENFRILPGETCKTPSMDSPACCKV